MCSETVTTSPRSQKQAWVPFPWWTSQSTTATRPIPRLRASSAHRAEFENRQ